MLALAGGTGFVGSAFRAQYPGDVLFLKRSERATPQDQILYFISTTDNYNVLDNPTRDVETNLLVLCEHLRELRPEQTFNFVSSWFVYGTEWGTESAACDPRGFYSITKRAAEQLVVSYCTTHGIPWRIFRLANCYGPGDAGASPKKNALTNMIREMKWGKEELGLYWGGDSFRNYIHVSDCARALCLALEKAPYQSILNIGARRSYRFRELLETAQEIMGTSCKFKRIEPTEFHKQIQTKNFFMDISRLEALGFVPEISIKEGLAELCQSL